MKKRRIKLLKPSNYEIDMVNGPLFFKIIKFSLPLMLSGVLQLLYNAADIVVVGRYVGSTALAAVGSTASITNLIISLFIGLSVGTSVLVAQYQG
ncbi:MAG TPA: MATE family efflux transporter, partial [Ruminiclostridium sp.]|nr:MATE family efflux transporter [Ruminiclostridium sp.]